MDQKIENLESGMADVMAENEVFVFLIFSTDIQHI